MQTPPAQTLSHSQGGKRHRGRKILVFIGLFKLLHASLMILTAVGALWLTKSSVNERIRLWAEALEVGPYRRYLGDGLVRLLRLPHHFLWAVVIGAAFYAILFATEGVGLLMDKLWAEWLAVIATASLLPIEFVETIRRHHWQKAIGFGALLINAAIVVVLVFLVRARIRESRIHGQVG